MGTTLHRRDRGMHSLLFVSPTTREVSRLNEDDLSFAVVGIGSNSGKELSKALALDQYITPDLAVSVGFAGSLTASGNTGDLILCSDVIKEKDPSRRIVLEPSLLEIAGQIFLATGLHARSGSLLSVRRPLLSSHQKVVQGERTGALAADMEGYYLADSLYQLGIPHLAIRVILDKRNQNLPRFVERVIDDPSGAEWRHVLRSVWNPNAIRSLLVLAMQARTACAIIGEAANALAKNYGAFAEGYKND